jgi:hypothetical protein
VDVHGAGGGQAISSRSMQRRASLWLLAAIFAIGHDGGHLIAIATLCSSATRMTTSDPRLTT